ncbi:calcium-independent phospholipase A2-gamma-like isoform X16 [Brienomyrus brachyistius]|uniref:calcium-independent phospholipase A2-gamma-like isoform X13 n=1 Tax=Brienomyrus brachyistius TaxID=42636 RepID=UPI0020B192DC|nr:calcium-independent phospholipase A2-gamma-like isoform X13 [Brienomyrus brachyistius]XP_048873860.1 calcium-independent phospholipase A2-gamma-like isoform X14 [Brienomyrus brachyistius]XP_048873870.1 calcium-independent phospholipase A2-gamma-like isoform X15 [Brienomyrus brachyistius]XP_048873879.1 calcium-independent phospholipase A2-gamma-like isoform X16 [Brienomyrus brachyistius]
MPVKWIINTSMFSLSRGRHLRHQQGQCQALQCCSRLNVPRILNHDIHGLRWWRIGGTQVRVHRTWVFRPCRLHYSLGAGAHISPLSTSASLSCADRSPGMWRLKRTLDSVSRAISSTHTDLLSRISHLKSGPREGGGIRSSTSEAKGQGTGVHTVSEKAEGLQDGKDPKDSPTQGTGRPGMEVVDSSQGIPAPSQTPWLFHPSKLPVNLGETYNYLAHHVNEYFGNVTKPGTTEPGCKDPKASSAGPGRSDQSGVDTVSSLMSSGAGSAKDATSPPASPPSPKKGIGHYLSYPGPSVQAFVGSYITPLVPKFRPGSKAVEAVKDGLPPVEESLPKQADSAEARERKAAEDRAKRLLLQREKVGEDRAKRLLLQREKVGEDRAKRLLLQREKVGEDRAKRLLLQREKIIARVSVDNRTRALVQALQRASDLRLCISRAEDLSYHLLEFPETRGVAVKEQLVPCLLRLRQAGSPALQAAVRETLALVGYADPMKGWGVRLLSIDGGGTRGVVALRTLRKLEELTGKPTYQLFDYICGVSTGAILAFMLGMYQMSLDECEELYRRLGSEVFKQNVIVGTVKMGWSHAFYDSQIWETILKEQMGSDLMVETSRNPECPKVAAVSTIVNRGTPLRAFVFRNYNLPPGVRSHYLGGCQHKLWQAIRASSAAPGYFQEFMLGDDLHQDGGLLVNNPTAVALHESQCLWPGARLQCVVSLGTGRLESSARYNTTYTSLKTKLSHVISSATDTEEVHTMLDALLPPNTYFRFNPYLSEDIPLDERRRERLALLQLEGQCYLERNEHKLRRAASVLLGEKSALQRLGERAALRGTMLRGMKRVPFFSRSWTS